ncbi:MAG: hypothetical protein PHG48_08375 [Eubacteriales bacterium]|nr:hypothetical protein [Eubacteriales bacterium]
MFDKDIAEKCRKCLKTGWLKAPGKTAAKVPVRGLKLTRRLPLQ